MNIEKDPHKHKQSYLAWKKKGCLMVGINKPSYDIFMRYIEDMEIGANVSPSSKKGSRSYGRLRNIKTKLQTLTLIFQDELGINSIEELVDKDRELLLIIKRMREGNFKSRRDGKTFRAIGTYMKAFKAFWHWYQRIKRKEGINIPDITVDIDSRDEKPKFNYFTIEQMKLLCDNAKYDYKVMMMFLFDSGIRAPTEMMNVKVSDLEWNEKKNHYTLTIRSETSKTFGRRIKLLLSSKILKEYIKRMKLKSNNYLFTKTPQRVNQYLKNLGWKILGIGEKEKKEYGGRKYNIVITGITLYDFRHSSACYWLPRYKSESALKYRFGWKKSEMIHYYTELLGMRDTIEEDDLYIDISKTELENQIQAKGGEIDLLNEQLKKQDEKIQEMTKILELIQLDKMIKKTNEIQVPSSNN